MNNNIKTKPLFYPVIMFFGGIIFYSLLYGNLPFQVLCWFSWELFYPSFLLGLVLEIIRWKIRTWKSSEKVVTKNPFWVDWVEASFSIWWWWIVALVIRSWIF